MAVSVEDLNEQQTAICEHEDGPILVNGGPGSGKTTVLHHRHDALVRRGVDPSSILITTFSRKAVRELEDRITTTEDGSAHVGTIHSVFYRIVKDNHDKVGFDSPHLNVYHRDEVEALLEEIIKDVAPRPEWSAKMRDSVAFFRTNLEKVRTRAMRPRELEDAMADNEIRFSYLIGGRKLDPVTNAKHLMPKVYRMFLERLYENNAVDFAGMQYQAYVLLENDEAVRKHYRDKYEHILVDEAQDLSYVQYKLIDTLGRDHKNVCLIGDSCQNIYSWRGSDHRFMAEFKEDYGATEYTLTRNYRSTQQILDAVNKIVPHLEGDGVGHPPLVADKGASHFSVGHPKITQYDNEHLERAEIAEEIDELINRLGYDQNQIAIMFRTKGRGNAKIDAFQRALHAEGIHAADSRGVRFMDRKEIQWLMTYLKAYMQPDDDIVVWNALERIKGIGQGTLSHLSLAKDEYESLADFIEGMPMNNDIPLLGKAKTRQLKDAVAIIKGLKDSEDPVEHIFIRTGLNERIMEWDGEPQERKKNIDQFATMFAKFPYTRDGVAEFFDDLANREPDRKERGIQLTTMHGAKGKEYDVVFLPEIQDGDMPHPLSDDIEEEKRLFYVAVSRAREKCYISYHKSPSAFIDYLQ